MYQSYKLTKGALGFRFSMKFDATMMMLDLNNIYKKKENSRDLKHETIITLNFTKAATFETFE